MKAKKKIAFIGQAEYFRFHYENDLSPEYEVYSHQLRYGATPEYYSSLVDFDADINIFFRGELVPAEVIRRLSGKRVALSTEPFPKLKAGQFDYTLDSLGRFRSFLDIFNCGFDHIFHYDAVSEEFFESQGIKLSGFIALPIATGTYKLHRKERVRDVLFIGRSTPLGTTRRRGEREMQS